MTDVENAIMDESVTDPAELAEWYALRHARLMNELALKDLALNKAKAELKTLRAQLEKSGPIETS